MSNGRFFGFWMLAFLGFPLGGLLAIGVVGSIDHLATAALAGGLAGLVIGLAQFLVLRRRAGVGPEWILTTTAGLALGNAIGAGLTDYGTEIGDLLVMGVVAGVAVGVAQWMTLRRRQPLALFWPVAVAIAWPVGWLVTWSIGVDVERGYAVFGASGALVFAAITGVAMVVLTRRSWTSAAATVGLGMTQP